MTKLRRLLVLLATLLALPLATADTCMSPFVKRTGKPEKYLYVFCVSLGKHNDALITIDVEPGTPRYGTVIHRLDLGSSDNETHHFGYTDDRTHIWGCSLFSSRVFV